MAWVRIKQGEGLPTIAAKVGRVDWEAIWKLDENAPLRELRKTPHVLAPGDRVFLPDLGERAEACETGARHVFSLRCQPVPLVVFVKDWAGRPVRNAPYRLDVDEVTHRGTTDNTGRLEQQVHPRAERGRLIIYDPGEPSRLFLKWDLRLSHLDPLDEISGVQGRLRNLGFLKSGRVSGSMDVPTKRAIRRFQAAQSLPVTGCLDGATKERLREVHAGT